MPIELTRLMIWVNSRFWINKFQNYAMLILQLMPMSKNCEISNIIIGLNSFFCFYSIFFQQIVLTLQFYYYLCNCNPKGKQVLLALTSPNHHLEDKTSHVTKAIRASRLVRRRFYDAFEVCGEPWWCVEIVCAFFVV